MRLINADELMKAVESAENSMEQHGREFSFSFMSPGQEISTEWYYVKDLIEQAETIDAVPVVVRCKDCKLSKYDKLFGNTLCGGSIIDPEGYCHRGKRKDDE